MPVVHNLDLLFLSLDTIVDVIRFAQKPSNTLSFPVRRSKFWKNRQRLRAIDKIIAEANRCLRIVLCDKAERKLFSSPSTDFLADAFEGNAFAGIKLGSGLIETRQKGGLFRFGHHRFLL